MPKVEQYGANKQNLSFAPGAQAPTRSLDKFAGAQLAGGLNDVGKALALVHDDLTSTQAEDAQVQFQRAVSDYQRNPDTGYLNTHGKNAVNGATAAAEELQNLRKSYSADLNGTARDKFDKVAKSLVTSELNKINIHAAKGQNDYKIETNKALQVSSLEQGASETDPVLRDQQLQLGLSYVKDGNEFNGITGPAAKKILGEYRSAFHSSVITAMAYDPGRAAEALDYFKKHKSELNHDDKINMHRLVESTSMIAIVQSRADEIIAKNLSLTDSMKMARNEKDATVREKLVPRVRARKDEQRVAKARADADHLKAMADKASRGEHISAAEMMGMTLSDRSMLAKMTNRAISGEPMVNDKKTYTILMGGLNSKTHVELVKIAENFYSTYANKLDTRHYENAFAHVVALRDENTSDAKPEQKSSLTFNQAFNDTAGQNSVKSPSKKMSEEDAIKWYDLHQKAAAAIDTMKLVKGRQTLSFGEQSEAIKSVFTDNVLKHNGGFLGIGAGEDTINAALADPADLTGSYNLVKDPKTNKGYQVHVDLLPVDRVNLLTRGFILVRGRKPSRQELSEMYVAKFGVPDAR